MTAKSWCLFGLLCLIISCSAQNYVRLGRSGQQTPYIGLSDIRTNEDTDEQRPMLNIIHGEDPWSGSSNLGNAIMQLLYFSPDDMVTHESADGGDEGDYIRLAKRPIYMRLAKRGNYLRLAKRPNYMRLAKRESYLQLVKRSGKYLQLAPVLEPGTE